MCGADRRFKRCVILVLGSSPRVRSRLSCSGVCGSCNGIISACAEQTAAFAMDVIRHEDHLRVCGADVKVRFTHGIGEGSSPRVRSRRSTTRIPASDGGIISACAEQTRAWPGPCASFKDHLRVCGADTEPGGGHVGGQGSSPRVRSRRVVFLLG